MIDLSTLSQEQLLALKAMKDAGVRTPSQTLNALKAAQLDVVAHAQTTFYIPETAKPIILESHQQLILKICAGEHSYPNLLPFYSTVEYSTPKKHGKTATSGAYAKWRAESSTLYDEILFFANDETQSRGRAYQAILYALQLNPLWDEKHRLLLDKDGNVVWRVIEDYLEHVPTHTKVRAVNVDYRGEAGSNPSLSVWTEVWGYDTEKQEKLFDEMTPVLTRYHSQRFLEGYAGYTGRSLIQEKVEGLLTDPDKGGRQLTLDDIPDWPWPDEPEGLLPLYVNDSAGMFGYLDRGPRTRLRMPWLQGIEGDRYYSQQQLSLNDPQQFERLHNNYWISPVDIFIPIEWWDACADSSLAGSTAVQGNPWALPKWREPIYIRDVPSVYDRLGPETPNYEAIVEAATGTGSSSLMAAGPGASMLELYAQPWNWRIVGEPVPVVISADASVTGDCTALVGVSRHPQQHQDIALRMAWKWDPPRGSKIDYETTPCAKTNLSLIQTIYKTCMEYNVVQLAYDNWQLHHLTTQLTRASIVWCREFKQGTPRDVADKQLYDLIKLRRIGYDPGADPSLLCLDDIRRHLQQASRTMKPKEDTKFHIVKANGDSKIDLVVATSMASAECLRLDI